MLCFAIDRSNAPIEIHVHVIVADYSYCKRQPLTRPRVVLSQCAHVVVPEEEDSFEYDAEEELDIPGGDDGDSEETDGDYVPEGGAGSSGESDGEGGDIQEEWMGKVLTKKGEGKIQKEGVGNVPTKKREGKIQKEGVGKVHTKKRGG